ncbi:MAG: serine hydrolase domain-containing protein [Gemmatimonadaceae bacterium]
MKRSSRLAALTLAVTLGAFPRVLSAQARGVPPAAFPAELDQYIEKAMRDWEVPGLAVAIVRHDTVLAAKGYGVRELGKPDRVDASTVFSIASLTKSFTAAAAAILVDEGKLAWDAPVRRYLPAFRLSDPYLTDQVTVRDLLAHRTGLHASNMMWVMTGIDRAELVRRARYMQPERPFRTGQLYSNAGYAIAGEALAAAAGQSYEELIRSRLFAPLGMRSSTITMEALAQQPNKVSPHAIIGGVQRPIGWRNIDVIAPAGSINSTATDMAQWLRFQLGDGTFRGTRLISAASMWEMHSPKPSSPSPRR